MDGATEFTGKHTDFIKQARQMQIKLHTAEQGRKNWNHVAEREIGFLSGSRYTRLKIHNSPHAIEGNEVIIAVNTKL
jgi:hypothetical protein